MCTVHCVYIFTSLFTVVLFVVFGGAGTHIPSRFLLQNVQTRPGANWTSCAMVPGFISCGKVAAPSSAEVMNEWSYTSGPPHRIPPGVHGYNFTALPLRCLITWP